MLTVRWLLIITAFFGGQAYAAVYEKTDASGDVSFSDQYSPGAKKVHISTPVTFKPAALPKSAKKTLQENKKQEENTNVPIPEVKPLVSYTSFSIASPSNKQTFQNQRVIPVVINVAPSLQNADKVQLLVDGAPYGKAQATTGFTLNQLNRGSHTVSARIINKEGRTIKTSNSVIIYVHYAAVGT